MDRKVRNGAVAAVMFATFMGFQGAASAGRVESSKVVGPGQDASIDGAARAQAKSCDGRNTAAGDAELGEATDSRLAEYLELHGRVVDRAVRATMMPWSTLQHVAN